MVLLVFPLSAQGRQGSYAIVADSRSLAVAGDEIREYAAALRYDGLETVIIEDRWKHPDSIRQQLRSLYKADRKFEGAVFIGDIPVPMIRDAQHMTSAFKMDQVRYSWDRSSVPSDRFYEDFDLEFTLLRPDTNGLYFYYSLNHSSPQRLTPDIYSGRIRIPGDSDGSQLRAYLKKAAAAHRDPGTVDELLLFAGHGYNSESMTARLDEKAALLQQFPQLNRQRNGLEYIDFTFDAHVKNRILSVMAEKMIDIALLHHHGTYDAQLASAELAAKGVNQNITNIQNYLRSKVRGAKDTTAAKQRYIDWLGVPDAWFRGANDPEQMLIDSIWSAGTEIVAGDVEKYDIKARFIMFDACFNGSFHRDGYISAAYLYGKGRTVAAQANTVNSLQDKYPDEMIGLLSYGMRVGEWNRLVASLETHIIGDPAFRFRPSDQGMDAVTMQKYAGNNSRLLRLTRYPHPDVQAWALRQLFENGYDKIGALLEETYFSSPYATTRVTAMHLLSEVGGDPFVRVTAAALDDSYELARRFAAIFCQQSGDPRLAPALIRAVTDANISRRVNYQAVEALAYFDRETLEREFARRFEGVDTANYMGAIYRKRAAEIESRTDACARTINSVTGDEVTDRNRMFDIRSLRNLTYHPAVEPLRDYLLTAPGDDIEIALLEALGWFRHSYRKDLIEAACREIIAGEDRFSAAVRDEALRTINRLK